MQGHLDMIFIDQEVRSRVLTIPANKLVLLQNMTQSSHNQRGNVKMKIKKTQVR
jgi:hypothetical protein